MRVLSFILVIGLVCSALYLGLGMMKPERNVCAELPGYRGNVKLHMTVPRRAKVRIYKDRLTLSQMKYRGAWLGTAFIPVVGRDVRIEIDCDTRRLYTINELVKMQSQMDIKARSKKASIIRLASIGDSKRILKVTEGVSEYGREFYRYRLYTAPKGCPYIYTVSYVYDGSSMLPNTGRPVDRAVARKVLETCYIEKE